MRAEYIPEETADAPLLFLGELTPSDAAALITALSPLAAGARHSVALHHLGCWNPANEIRVEALATEWDAGCAPVGVSQADFQCAFRSATWDQIIGLLAPFAEAGVGHAHGHQYLSQDGPVTWMVSTDSTW